MRGRPANVMPSVQFNVKLPLDLKTKMDLHLYSGAEGRVPVGGHQKLIVKLLEDYFTSLENRNVTNS